MMLNLHVPKLPTRKVLRAEVGEGSMEMGSVGGRGQLQMLLLHVACCFRRFWLCGKLNASVVWLTDDKDWSGLAGGSNGFPPLPPTPEQANTCFAREREGTESRQSWGSVFVIARHVYSSASLSPTASTTAAHAARPACCRLVYNVNEGRGAMGARLSSACVATS